VGRKKKQRDPEYRLRVFPCTDEQTRTAGVALVVETVKEFVSFAYEVLLEDHQEGRTISLKILGLHAPVSVMPGIGPARGFRFYENLSGKQTIVVTRLDGQRNEFDVTIGLRAVVLHHSPKDPFVLFSTDPVRLTT
jgi:hypothetical protein